MRASMPTSPPAQEETGPSSSRGRISLHADRFGDRLPGLPTAPAPLPHLAPFQAVINAEDKQQVPIAQQNALSYVSIIEESMVKGIPYSVPAKYDNLPQLQGRANLEMKASSPRSGRGHRA